MSIKTIIQKAAAVIAGAANFVVRVNAGVRVTISAQLRAARLNCGIAIQRVVGSLKARTNVGVQIVRVFATGSARVTVLPGIACSNRVSGTPGKPVTLPAFDIVQTFINLVRTAGSVTASQEAVAGRSDWANIGNAQGLANGTNATFAGNALGARSGRLVLAYTAPTGKTALTITSVKLRFHYNQTGTTLNNGTLKIGYRFGAGGSLVQLSAPTGNVDFLAAGQEFDITAAVAGNWTTLGTLQAYAEASTAILNTSAAAVDAVVVIINANRTEVN